jgi:hypothetical protein
VAARHPFRLDDLGDVADEVDAVLVRRLRDVGGAVDEHEPDVVLIDTGFPEGRSMECIADVRIQAPAVGVLALTPDPPPAEDVALATRAGALGFVDHDASSDQFRAAIDEVHAGRPYLPATDTMAVLDELASELETTARERRSRLMGILVALIPVTGAIAAILSLLYRRYLGQIGVRPVDIAIDPTSRVIDVVTTFFLLMGVFGPLLLVPNWLHLVRRWRPDRALANWITGHPRLARLLVSIVVLGITLYLARGPDLLLVFFIGPLVTVSFIARALDASDELPRVLRIEHGRPIRAVLAGGVVLVLFVGLLGYEAVVVGPQFGGGGAQGIMLPKTLGFRARPMRVVNVDTGAEEEMLYLGGNADLYVLVDPCDDDRVDYVSVGATRLSVIDEVHC